MARHSRRRFKLRSHRVANGPGEGIGFVWPSGRGKGVSSSNDESQPAKKLLASSSGKNTNKKSRLSKKSLELEISKLNNKIVDATSRDKFSDARGYGDETPQPGAKNRARVPVSPGKRARDVIAAWVRIMQFLPSAQLCRCVLSREIFRQSRAVLKHCDFSGLRVSAIAVQRLIKTSTELHVLNLYGCQLGAHGLRRLANTIPRGLEQLNLNGNRIGKEGSEQLASILHKCNNLSVVDLRWNSLTDAVTPRLAGILPRLPALSLLDLRYNCLSEASKALLQKKKCSTLKLLC